MARLTDFGLFRRRVPWHWPIILILATALLSGSAAARNSTFGRSPHVDSPSAMTQTPSVKHVVALGDSVTSGYACGCIPFPQVYGKDISRVRGWPVVVDNLGEGGLNSTDLLDRLDDPGAHTDRAVARSDIVLVTIGANDFSSDHDAVTQGDCYQDENAECVQEELAQLRKNVSVILTRVRKLRSGLPTAVLVTGYWNVFESGDVASSTYPDAGVLATQRLTREVNDVLRDVTMTSGDTYVDLLGPFTGPASGGNVTSLLARDGDHPNAAGHALIALRLVAAGLAGLVGN